MAKMGENFVEIAHDNLKGFGINIRIGNFDLGEFFYKFFFHYKILPLHVLRFLLLYLSVLPIPTY